MPILVESLLERHIANTTGRPPRVNTETMELFKSYPWPGNVRELRNVLERAAIACDRGIIGRQDLPADFGRAPATQSCGAVELAFPGGHHGGSGRAGADPANPDRDQSEQDPGSRSCWPSA